MNFREQLKTRRFKSDKPRIAWFRTDWHTNEFREQNNLYGGIGYYRVILPARYLTKWFDIDVIGADFKDWGTEDETYTTLGRDYDLIITKNIDAPRTASNILATAKHFNRKVLLDIDDNYFDIREENAASKEYAIGERGRGVTGAFLELADGVITSTEPLKEIYQKINKKVHVLPNCNDIKDWPKPVKKDDGIIRIGFAGGRGHDSDLKLIAEPVAKILTKYENTEFYILGACEPEFARELGGMMLKFGNHKILERFKIGGGTPSWKGYPELLAQQGWDIGLCPLIDDKFNQGKSHIKWLEYSMMKMATIASPVYPFKEEIDGVKVIEHGKTGLFAKNADEWTMALEMLIRNPDVRMKMGKNAYEFVEDNWQMSSWAESWKKVIEQYL